MRRQYGKIAAFILGIIAIGGLLAVQLNKTSSGAADTRAYYQPLTVANSSLNGNAIWGIGESWQNVVSAGGLDDWAAFFADSNNSKYKGLSDTGSMTIDSVPYTFNWTGNNTYAGKDTIRLYQSHPQTTVNLDTVGVYKQLYVLATAGGPGEGNYANFEVKVNYTDGTTDVTDYRIYDWFDNTPVSGVYKLSGIKRRELGNGSYGGIGSESDKPYLQSATIAVDSTKLVRSLDLILTGRNGSTNTQGIFCGIFAITGMVDVSAPSAPTALPATNIDTNSFTANWEMNTNTESYRLDVALDENFTNILPNYNNLEVNSTSATITGLERGVTYYYRVRAVNVNGQSLSSNIISATTLDPDETAPTIQLTGDTTSIKQSDTLTVSASDPSGVANLELSSDGGSNWEPLEDPDNARVEITDNGTYLIRATDSVGNTANDSIAYGNIDNNYPEVAINTHGYVPDTWTNGSVVLTPYNVANNLGATTYQYSNDGETWQNYESAIVVANETNTDSTYYFKAISQAGLESDPASVTVKRDTSAPTATITGSDNSWNSFLNAVTFGLFFNETQSYQITANDDASGIANIQYLLTSETFDTAEAALAANGWTSIENYGEVSVDPETDFLIYYQITDNAGNTTVLNTDGIVLDTTLATIRGYAYGYTYDLEDGETYYLTQKLLVTDNKKLDTVAINGEYITVPADGVIELAGNRDAANTIVARDKAGNVTTVTINNSALANLLPDIDPDYVTSDDYPTLNNSVDAFNGVLFREGEHANDTEKDIIDDHLANLADTLELLDRIQADISNIETDYAGLPDVDYTNLDYRNAVIELNDRILTMLDEDTNHLTSAERQHLIDMLTNLQDMTGRIDEVTDETNRIIDDSEAYDFNNITPADEATIDQLINDTQTLLDTNNLNTEQRQDLEDVLDYLRGLSGRIEEVKQAITDATNADPTNPIDASVTPIDTNNVQKTDQQRLEDAAQGYADVLGEFASNLTSGDLLAIEGRITGINDAIDLLESIAQVERLFSRLPAATDVSADNQGLIGSAKSAYEALSEYAKGLLDPALVSKYNAVLAAYYFYLNDMPQSFANETLDVFWWGIIILLVIGLALAIVGYIHKKHLERAAAARHDTAEAQHKTTTH